MRGVYRTAIAAAAMLAVPAMAQADDEIVVGAALVISGPFASYGTDAKAGIDVAVEELNEAGGVLGRKVVIDYDDTGGDRAKAVALYQAYAARPEVVAAMSIASSEFVALNPIVSAEGPTLISIGSAIPFEPEKFAPCAFRMNLILDKAMPSVLQQLMERTGAKTISVIYDTVNNSTVAEADTVQRSLEGSGLDLAGVESYSTGEQNFTLQLTNIAQADPDVLWVAATTDEAALIISQARELGIDAAVIGGAGLNDPRIGDLPGESANGVMTFALFNSADERPAVQSFAENFKKMNDGHAPSAYNALGYDAMQVLAAAIERAGTSDRKAVCEALGETDDFAGVNGPFRYEGKGDNVAQKPLLLVYQGDGFKPAAD